jgi:transposase
MREMSSPSSIRRRAHQERRPRSFMASGRRGRPGRTDSRRSRRPGARRPPGRAAQRRHRPRAQCAGEKAGSKSHILCDANGLPLHALLSAANTHDSKLLSRCSRPTPRDRRGRPSRPRRRPDELHADKGYDYRRCRQYQHRRGIKVRIARGIEDKSKLGRVRWFVERTISWLPRFKRLGLRYDRTERTTRPLLTLCCTLINIRRMIKTEL